MGIWQHTHTVTTTEVSPDLGEFAEILDDIICVEMIPLCYCWGCITFQTASYIHEIHHITHTMWLSTMICCPLVYISSLVTQFTHTTWIRFWGSGLLVMMWLCHGWGWQCENISTWISLSGDLAFSHQDGIYGFKFPKRFSELSQEKTSLYSPLLALFTLLTLIN